MEGYFIPMNEQNQYYKNGYTTESIVYIQYNPFRNSNDILHWDRKVSPKVHMEAQKTLKSQINPEPKQQHWK
jgi:hypothetical protein